jgi:hypothetical protein
MTLHDVVLSAEAARILGCTPATVRALERLASLGEDWVTAEAARYRNEGDPA